MFVGLLLPQLFHESTIVADPVKAHTEYLRDPRVLDMIVEGIHASDEPIEVAEACSPLVESGVRERGGGP